MIMKKQKNMATILREYSSEEGRTHNITEIKHFSPEGIENIPSGHPTQKEGFIKECIDNSHKFKSENYQYLIKTDFNSVETMHPKQYGLSDYRGGIIIFSLDVSRNDVSKHKLISWFKDIGISSTSKFFSKSKLKSLINKFNLSNDQKLASDNIDDYIGAFSTGHFFLGRYIGDTNKVFNEKSLSIEVNGISPKGLIYLAEQMAKEFNQETVLIKELKANKIFLANQIEA